MENLLDSIVDLNQEDIESAVGGDAEETPINFDKVVKYSQKVYLKFDELMKEVEPHLSNSFKTYLIIKAILVLFTYEKEHNKDEKLIGKYIKLAQLFAAGGSTGLVHAVCSKLLGQEPEEKVIVEEKTHTVKKDSIDKNKESSSTKLKKLSKKIIKKDESDIKKSQIKEEGNTIEK